MGEHHCGNGKKMAREICGALFCFFFFLVERLLGLVEKRGVNVMQPKYNNLCHCVKRAARDHVIVGNSSRD